MKIITSIRVFLSKTVFQKIKNLKTKLTAEHYLKKNRKKIRGNGTINVAFIVYEPAMWDKQEPVFLKMLENNKICPTLIVLPDETVSEADRNKKISFFFEKYKNVLLFSKDTLDLFEKEQFHYTFYQTPYNHKYPEEIRPNKLVKYTKICFIPYAYIGSEDFLEVSTRRDFFENVYFGFMDSKPTLDYLLNKFKRTTAKQIQNFLFLGYPSFEAYFKKQPLDNEIRNVLWIPRWSYAEKGGGSNFLKYKDLYNDLAKDHPDLDFTMRPHPLMFTTLEKQGLFSREEIDAYKADLRDANVELDQHSLLDERLEKTDLMIADYSSIIIAYFLSGRPIIYCDGGLNMYGIYKDLYDAMYVAHSWEDVLSFINVLKEGKDPLKEKRLEIIQKEKINHKDSAVRIVERIINDFRN